jgi:hypothetical protein
MIIKNANTTVLLSEVRNHLLIRIESSSVQILFSGENLIGKIVCSESNVSLTATGIDSRIVIDATNEDQQDAALGAPQEGRCSSVVITNGSIAAHAGQNGAGIGSGYDARLDSLTILAGNVTASSAGSVARGAGIGAGFGADMHTFVIVNSNVTAAARGEVAGYGSGIGAGYRATLSNLTVLNSNVTAVCTGSDNIRGSALGPGSSARINSVTISSSRLGAICSGGYVSGSALGGGARASLENLWLIGANASANCSGSTVAGAGIGTGEEGEINQLVILGGHAKASYSGGHPGVALGPGTWASMGNLTITNCNLSAGYTGASGTGIGRGVSAELKTVRLSGHVTLKTASVNAGSILTSNETDLLIITNGTAVFKAGVLSTQGSLDLVIQYGEPMTEDPAVLSHLSSPWLRLETVAETPEGEMRWCLRDRSRSGCARSFYNLVSRLRGLTVSVPTEGRFEIFVEGRGVSGYIVAAGDREFNLSWSGLTVPECCFMAEQSRTGTASESIPFASSSLVWSREIFPTDRLALDNSFGYFKSDAVRASRLFESPLLRLSASVDSDTVSQCIEIV